MEPEEAPVCGEAPGEEEDLALEAEVLRPSAGPFQEPAAPWMPARSLGSLDLEKLLRLHAVQASHIANQAAIAEGKFLSFAQDQGCPDPAHAIKIVECLERVRANAVGDIRRTVSVLSELHRKPVPVQIAVVAQAARPLDSGPKTGRLLDGAE